MRVIQNDLEVRPRLHIKCWASQIEDEAVRQAANLASLPFAISHIALMPDAHPGYGMPIGGVLFADKAIVPYAVGVDIGCGVSLIDTGLNAYDIDPDSLQLVLDRIARLVPVGNGPGAQFREAKNTFDWIGMSVDIRWALSQVLLNAVDEGAVQLGTLGGGNHFIEVQKDPDGGVYVMLHSGSRSVGKKVCDHWHKVALGLNDRWHSDLPDRELAYLPWESDEARTYFEDMRTAMRWAEQNRAAMREAVKTAVAEYLPDAVFRDIVDVHHNYAAWESHRGRNGIVHRKGAVRARAGEVVLIPGSMGTASYIGEGLGSPDSFESCQHGAGRARSRAATLRLETEDQFVASMTGVMLGGHAAGARDESPFAYKDVDQVMADSSDLVRSVVRLVPMGVVKG